jgi:hypothetical protein
MQLKLQSMRDYPVLAPEAHDAAVGIFDSVGAGSGNWPSLQPVSLKYCKVMKSNMERY